MKKATCTASASMLENRMVHHDRGLYPVWCSLELGHSGNHSDGTNTWPQEPVHPDTQEMVARLEAGAL